MSASVRSHRWKRTVSSLASRKSEPASTQSSNVTRSSWEKPKEARSARQPLIVTSRRWVSGNAAPVNRQSKIATRLIRPRRASRFARLQRVNSTSVSDSASTRCPDRSAPATAVEATNASSSSTVNDRSSRSASVSRGSSGCRVAPGTIGDYDRSMPDRLHFTDSDEANALIAADPMALLVGFALDQQITVQHAFTGPLTLKQRLGSIDPATLAAGHLEAVFREKPAIHRYPGSMAKRVHDLAVHVRDTYDGDAARVWTDAADADALRTNIAALPGFGEMKTKALGAVLAKHFGVTAADDLVPPHPTLGDVDSPQALTEYQAGKRAHKAELRGGRA